MSRPGMTYIWSEPEYICGDYDCQYVVDDQGVTNYSCVYDCRWTSSTLLEQGFWGGLIVNPSIGMTLTSFKSSSIATAVLNSTTLVKKQPSPLVAASYRGQNIWDYNNTNLNLASFIGVELTFQINSPTKNSDRTLVIYKVYPRNYSSRNVVDSYNAAVGPGGRMASYDEVVVEENQNAENLEFLAYPNPVKESTAFQFHVTNPKGSIVSLIVYDLMGKPVKSIASNRSCPIGKYTMKWNTTSDRGTLVSNGTYIAVLTRDDKIVSRKIIINN